MTDTMKKCNNCGYEWETRIENPVSCPKCKRRFDYPGQVRSDDNGSE